MPPRALGVGVCIYTCPGPHGGAWTFITTAVAAVACCCLPACVMFLQLPCSLLQRTPNTTNSVSWPLLGIGLLEVHSSHDIQSVHVWCADFRRVWVSPCTCCHIPSVLWTQVCATLYCSYSSTAAMLSPNEPTRFVDLEFVSARCIFPIHKHIWYHIYVLFTFIALLSDALGLRIKKKKRRPDFLQKK